MDWLSSFVFGTVELPDKPIMLPPFVEATHCLGYHLTRKGRAVADRVVSVLGYACPDITYSPSLYPITAALLHFMPVKVNSYSHQSSPIACLPDLALFQ
ncbi:hypothetical protein HF086_001879 [Spodoptera exigua]|uniref:Uncharacterized protein n=1 Tax=Spodoptera exigua TaxID=7107 RepID=A0A922S992_SPOEX|nr:hypothetical protein HF086_001879 [Spodoptera exigua]